MWYTLVWVWLAWPCDLLTHSLMNSRGKIYSPWAFSRPWLLVWPFYQSFHQERLLHPQENFLECTRRQTRSLPHPSLCHCNCPKKKSWSIISWKKEESLCVNAMIWSSMHWAYWSGVCVHVSSHCGWSCSLMVFNLFVYLFIWFVRLHLCNVCFSFVKL